MSYPFLLQNNSQNIDLIDFYINNNGPRFGVQQPQQKTLELTVQNSIEKIKGIVLSEGILYTKEEARNFSSAIVSDATFINNLIFFINLFAEQLESPVQVNYNSVNYVVKKSINVGNKRFYILESA
jgi:hypothetical protein